MSSRLDRGGDLDLSFGGEVGSFLSPSAALESIRAVETQRLAATNKPWQLLRRRLEAAGICRKESRYFTSLFFLLAATLRRRERLSQWQRLDLRCAMPDQDANRIPSERRGR